MKHTLSILVKLLILGISLMALASCQDEIEPEIEIDMDGIISDDPVAQSIVAVSTKDGSADNIIDRSSCTTVIFPITGIFEDEEQVFEALEEVEVLGAGALEVDWIYPFNVIIFDHSEITLNSEDELEAIQDSCIEGGSDADNECIDFIYPFTIQVFDTRTENVASRQIYSDREAYNTFISPDLITTIEFPVRMIDAMENTLEAFSNEELTNIIINAANSCDEQDIIEFEEIFEDELKMLFTSTDWEVSFYESDGVENTSLFSGYTLRFNEDMTLQSQGEEGLEGEWDIELLDTGESVSIEFDTEEEPLFLLNENWTITDHNQTQITLEYQDIEEGTKRLQLSSI
ncbi:hypothetical protein QWY93_15850 [Echinicola jeungdonensis]|uniref:Lipocalin-like domain-containing protein n=1 Tax=Echinicola jeungdonensis TaxID=709343 RepID=A0ABV5J6X8_9BACT|nr:hypothetical protein [Echinicola jeungdonensis]MDN3670794.1 hypothetical protein [Echinicola jeungdonensis]